MNAQGGGHRTGSGQNVAPDIVFIHHHHVVVPVCNGNNITLDVGNVEICCAVIGEYAGNTQGIINNIQGVAVDRHIHQLAAVVHIAVGGAAVATPGAHTGGAVVGIVPSSAVSGHGGKLPAVLSGVTVEETLIPPTVSSLKGNFVTVKA